MKSYKSILFAIFYSIIINKNAISQSNFLDSLKMERVFPKERVEKRVYDSSKPDVIVWHTEPQTPDYPGGSTTRTMGFIEAASDERKILCVGGFLVQRKNINGIDKGFLLQFATHFTYLSLPRRTIGKEIKFQDRYALMNIFSENSSDGIRKGLFKFDYRKIRLIENGKVYHPKKILIEELNEYGGLKDVPPYLVDITDVVITPKENKKMNDLYIDEVLFFEIDHMPLNFKIEIPSFFVNDAEVPLPVFYFEPYNTVTDKWMNN
jgi:hypothetical protein